MKVLVACEESQAVTKEFRRLGHEAYSCDIEPCSGRHPEWHLQQDVLPLLQEQWDMIIAFPPCTDLAVSGARWFKEKQQDGRQQRSIDFFMEFTSLKCAKSAIENPVGIMSTLWKKPDQIIQPWQFGDEYQKTTCLWVNGMPLLKEAQVIKESYSCACGNNFDINLGKYGCHQCLGTHPVKKGRGHFVLHGGKWIPKWYSNNKRSRSKTFSGIARAMAEQWGGEAND